MTLDEVAEHLYGLPPEEFVGARTAAERQARANGDRPLARAINGLAKPTVVAWLANDLVRRHRDEVSQFLALGAALREATASLDGEQLRSLSRQQHQVVYALVAQARSDAAGAGRRVSDDSARRLEETLRAALADDEAAAALAGGRLTDALSHVGFVAPDDASAPALRPSAVTAPSGSDGPQDGDDRGERPHPDDAERARREAELAVARQEADDAAAAAEDARAAAEAAHQHVEDVRARAADLAKQVDARTADLARLREELQRAQQDLERTRRVTGAAEDEIRSARSQAATAERVAREAARRLAEATRRLERLQA